MNNLYDEAAQWITENFPPPEVSDHEAEQIQVLGIRKAIFLRPFIIETYRMIGAIRQVDGSITGQPLRLRPTFDEAIDSLQADDGDLLFSEPPDASFVDDMKRILADGFSAYRDDPRCDSVDDLMVVYHFYSWVLPRMRSVSPVFLLRLSMAEDQLLHLAVTVVERIQLHEAPTKSMSLQIKGARRQRGVFDKDREETIRVFLAMPEKVRMKLFIKGKASEFYSSFTEKAGNMKIYWRRGEIPPAKGTVEKYIKEYLNESPKVASSTSQ